MFPSTYVSQYLCFPVVYRCLLVPTMFLITCFPVPMFQSSLPMFHGTYYVPQYLCSQYLCFLPMFPSTYVSQESTHVSLYLSCFSVPMFASRLLFPTTYLCFQILMLFIFPSPYASRYLLFPSPIMFLSTYMFSNSLPMFSGTYVS